MTDPAVPASPEPKPRGRPFKKGTVANPNGRRGKNPPPPDLRTAIELAAPGAVKLLSDVIDGRVAASPHVRVQAALGLLGKLVPNAVVQQDTGNNDALKVLVDALKA